MTVWGGERARAHTAFPFIVRKSKQQRFNTEKEIYQFRFF